MRLSVIVTIVDGGRTLARCLAALAAQQDSPDLNVIVPWDDTVAGIPALAVQYPRFQFHFMGRVPTSRSTSRPAGQHELFDRRRAEGLKAATGDVLAILEDRGVPAPDWARTMVRLHERLPHAAVGGAVENGHNAALPWAVYFCDFHRYQRPFVAGSRGYVSDTNIGYKRQALEQIAGAWHPRYHETTVHWALRRAGETLYVTPELVVEQYREGLRLRTLLPERVAWGRLFAYTRAREMSLAARLGLAVMTLGLPVLLLVRHAGLQFWQRRPFGRLIRAAPAMAALLAAWSLGEALGYLTAEA